MAGLKLQDVRKSFGDLEVIKGVDLDVSDGEFVVFVGPSGCGKSTMLRMIAGLETVTSGEISIDGTDISHLPPAKRGIAMVFQSYALFPHMSVAENISFGLRLNGLPRQEIESRVSQVAETLQIVPLLDRTPRELSGGQRQRVAIGRAIIRNPRVFLFDEPLSNLDAALRVQMRLEIARLHARLSATMIYVTHDQTEAMTLADRIVVFNGGKIEQVGSPMDLYDHPANMFVAGFIGAPSINFIRAKSENNALLLALPGAVPFEGLSAAQLAGMEVVVGIRPEHLLITQPGKGDFDVTIEILEHLGAETFAYALLEGTDQTLTIRIPSSVAIGPGQRFGLKMDRKKIHLFDQAGRKIVN